MDSFADFVFPHLDLSTSIALVAKGMFVVHEIEYSSIVPGEGDQTVRGLYGMPRRHNRSFSAYHDGRMSRTNPTFPHRRATGGDGIPNPIGNCPNTPSNPLQEDIYQDGIGDAFDAVIGVSYSHFCFLERLHRPPTSDSESSKRRGSKSQREETSFGSIRVGESMTIRNTHQFKSPVRTQLVEGVASRDAPAYRESALDLSESSNSWADSRLRVRSNKEALRGDFFRFRRSLRRRWYQAASLGHCKTRTCMSATGVVGRIRFDSETTRQCLVSISGHGDNGRDKPKVQTGMVCSAIRHSDPSPTIPFAV